VQGNQRNIGGGSDRAVVASHLTKQFGDEYAVRDLSFQVPKGTIFGFIGPSGCGKTTTIRLLTGIYTPTDGEVEVLGSSPQKFSALMRRKIGYMPQLFVLYPDLSVWENLNFSASLFGLSLFGRSRKLKPVLDFVELYPHRAKLTRKISGGMQRRLSLASTLVHRPELIFLDEPTAGIDPILRRKFWDHFRELREQGRTLFITTQYVGEAAYCDYVGVMASGRLLIVATPEDLRRKAIGGDVIDLQSKEDLTWAQISQLQTLPYVRGRINLLPMRTYRLTVDNASTALPEVLQWSQDNNIDIESVKEFIPPFDDVFITLIQSLGEDADAGTEKK
jgi:ABC-2 type transport system ATP-binding protein